MSDFAISLRSVRVTAGVRTVLDLDNLSLGSDEFLAVMGPNGAGKSTLLRVCLGMQSAVSGEVHVLGQPLNSLNANSIMRLRREIGYVPQMLPARAELPLTVREVVAIGRTGRAGLFRYLKKQDWDVVDKWLEHLGITDLARRGFSEISGGEQRKAMIARAMTQEPRLLLLDEPTANLDLGWRERIVETIQCLYEETRLAVILVCHELEVVPPCCRRVAVLHHGRLLADGEPLKVFTSERIAELYGVGLTVVQQQGRHALVSSGRGD